MPRPFRRSARPAPAALLSGAPAAVLALALLAGTPAVAVAPPLSDPRIVAHFDIAQHLQPENIAVEPDGSVDLTFSFARQVGRVDPDGRLTVLATLPEPAHPATPVLGRAVVSGLVRAHDGTLYFGYATGTADLTGIWRLCPGGAPERIAALPADSLPNGLALDAPAGVLYSSDSALGLVWTVPLDGGAPVVWSDDALLKPVGAFGANGLKVHRGAVWVGNTDTGSLLRIPVRPDGAAGPAEVRADGLAGLDDFAFVGPGDDLLAALNPASEVVHLGPDGSRHTVLDAADGLSNPTSVGIGGDTVYVPSAAYFTMADPNLLAATLEP
ncbi:SMP-30/gluconolactonase/LRE family protein [Kitasatospora sp. NPDC058032]|uniref:SMP-30/gluconolactonase/LRE family protein n=1 Tax=Kitasatospora sp. NPDC058032 TaxID=3346307 RepID=UPI0036D7A493